MDVQGYVLFFALKDAWGRFRKGVGAECAEIARFL